MSDAIQNLSLKRRTFQIGNFTGLFWLVLACVVIISYAIYSGRQLFLQSVLAEARSLGIPATDSLDAADPVLASRILDSLEADPRVLSAKIYDANGSVFAGYTSGTEVCEMPVERIDEYQFHGRHLDVYIPLFCENAATGMLHVQFDSRELSLMTVRYSLLALGLIMASLFWTVFLSGKWRHSGKTPTAAIQSRDETVRQSLDALEKRLKNRTRQLEEATRELDSFTYSVSHDLQAPLRAINGFTRFLMEDYVEHLDSNGQRLGSVIQQNTRKMEKLINDLLEYSRVGRVKMHYADIDMTSLVDDVFREATSDEDRERITFRIGDLHQASGDYIMIRLVWASLVSNALKFSSQREQSEITISSHEEEDMFVYSVADNGAGFDMKYSDKMFGFFQRLHSEKEFQGTGVGLAFVQRIIHRHGGEVWAQGEVEKGATIYFSLPRVPDLETAIDEN